MLQNPDIKIGEYYKAQYCYNTVYVKVLEEIGNSHSQRGKDDNVRICEIIGTKHRLMRRAEELELLDHYDLEVVQATIGIFR